jgi:hypothetical protein
LLQVVLRVNQETKKQDCCSCKLIHIHFRNTPLTYNIPTTGFGISAINVRHAQFIQRRGGRYGTNNSLNSQTATTIFSCPVPNTQMSNANAYFPSSATSRAAMTNSGANYALIVQFLDTLNTVGQAQPAPNPANAPADEVFVYGAEPDAVCEG